MSATQFSLTEENHALRARVQELEAERDALRAELLECTDAIRESRDYLMQLLGSKS